MRLTEKEFQQMMKGSHAKINNSSTFPASNSKPVVSNDLERKKEIERFDGQVSVRITSYRKRLADPFGVSEKYAIDSIVDRGILKDDSCKEISEKESYHEQIKTKKGQEEKTVIVIELC